MKLHTVYKITQGSLLHSIWKQIPLTLPFLHWRRGWQIWGMNLHLALLKIWGLLFCSIFKDDHWHLDWGRTQKADCASGIWGFSCCHWNCHCCHWIQKLLPLNTHFLAATEYTLGTEATTQIRERKNWKETPGIQKWFPPLLKKRW